MPTATRTRRTTPRPRRLRFRLAVWIAVTFAVAGAMLLGAQYVLAERFLSTVTSDVTLRGTSFEVALCGVDAQSDAPCVEQSSGGTMTEQDKQAVREIAYAQEQLARRLMTALTWWSVGGVALFAVLASGLAWWIARRSLRRLNVVSDRVATITSDRLDQRIEIDGPRDEVSDLADSFDAMLDRLDEAFVAQRSFVANASHELRTPLASTRAALDVALAQDRVPPDLEPAIRRAVAATEHSARILDGLLVMARMQHDESSWSRLEHGDLGELVSDAVERLGEEAERRGVGVEVSAGFAPVVGDLDLLDQAVSNLVTNAVVHNVPGGTVAVSTAVQGHRAEVRVVNDGEVLDPDQVPRLTEPFHRGEATRLSAATVGSSRTDSRLGLGLAIVSQIVAHHGGDLRLVARPEGGLMVTMSLPAPPQEPEEDSAPRLG